MNLCINQHNIVFCGKKEKIQRKVQPIIDNNVSKIDEKENVFYLINCENKL